MSRTPGSPQAIRWAVEASDWTERASRATSSSTTTIVAGGTSSHTATSTRNAAEATSPTCEAADSVAECRT